MRLRRTPSPSVESDRTQERAERIRAFREELAQVELDRVVLLTEEQRRRLLRYHEGVLRRAPAAPAPQPAPLPAPEKATSLPAAVTASLLGAALLLVPYALWSPAPSATRIAALFAASAGTAFAAHAAARRPRWNHLASPLGFGALACFAAELFLLARACNAEPLPHALLPTAAFALALAYGYGLRPLLGAGVLGASAYLATLFAAAGGAHWRAAGARPEIFFPIGAALLLVAALVPHRRHPGFPQVYRLFGFLAVLGPLLVLANWGDSSYIRAPAEQVQTLYLAVGLTVAGLAIVAGLWRAAPGLIYVGTGFLVLFLCVRFSDRLVLLAAALGALAVAALAVRARSLRAESSG